MKKLLFIFASIMLFLLSCKSIRNTKEDDLLIQNMRSILSELLNSENPILYYKDFNKNKIVNVEEYRLEENDTTQLKSFISYYKIRKSQGDKVEWKDLFLSHYTPIMSTSKYYGEATRLLISVEIADSCFSFIFIKYYKQIALVSFGTCKDMDPFNHYHGVSCEKEGK